MKLFSLVKLYLLSVLLLVSFDMVWINLLAHSFYVDQIGYLLSPKPNLVPAVLFYLFYGAGLLYFIVVPSLKVKKLPGWRVFAAGAFFGLVAFGTYDLTSYATVIHWKLAMTVVDMLWGMFTSATVSLLGYTVARKYL